jgi:putative transposase
MSARVSSASAGLARCLIEAWFRSLADARRIIEAWRRDSKTVVPHSALGDLTPADF